MYSKFGFDTNLCIHNFYLTIKFIDDLNICTYFFFKYHAFLNSAKTYC